MEMQKGQKYKNWNDDIHEITAISPLGFTLKAKNIITGEISSFRYYQASGKYIKVGTTNIELGIFLN